MDVAISGDRACCLTQQLGPDMYWFAVASGFGSIDGQAVAPAVLGRLRSEFERRARGERLRRAEHRAKGMTSSLVSAFTRVNEDLHSRTASHEDYVTAGCSVTGVLLIQERAYLAHVGSTAAYLARDGYVVSLTKNDAFESHGVPILTRAIACAPTVDVSVCSFSLSEGDALVLAGRRLREAAERRQLADSVVSGLPATSTDQLLVVRYAASRAPNAPPSVRPKCAGGIVTGVLATIAFYALLCLR